MKNYRSLFFITAFTLAFFGNLQKENLLYADQESFTVNVWQEGFADLIIDDITSINPGYHSPSGNNFLRAKVTAGDIVQSTYSHAPFTIGTFRLRVLTTSATSYKVVADCGISGTSSEYTVAAGLDVGDFKLLSMSRTNDNKKPSTPESRDYLVISLYADLDPDGNPGPYEFRDLQTIMQHGASSTSALSQSRTITVKIHGDQLYRVRTGLQYSAFLKFVVINT